MKASEAKVLADTANTIKKMSAVFDRIRAAAAEGKYSIEIDIGSLPHEQRLVLESELLKYKVKDDSWQDEYDTWHKAKKYIVSWEK